MTVRMYSLGCLACLRAWFSSSRDTCCPYCDSDRVYDTGKGDH